MKLDKGSAYSDQANQLALALALALALVAIVYLLAYFCAAMRGGREL